MHRTTIMLPADLRSQATRRAREMGISLGELIRESLADWLGRTEAPNNEDSLLADDAIFEGPVPRNLAAEHDRYLYGDGSGLP